MARGGARPNTGGARPGAGRKPKEVEAGLMELLRKCWTEEDREACVRKMGEKAKGGDREAFALLMAYTYGKPKERVEHTGADGQPLFKAYQGVDVDRV